MRLAPIELGALIDSWVASDRVGVSETASAVTVSRLDAALTLELLAVTHQLGWDCDVDDAAGEFVQGGDIEDDLGPFVATILKDVEGSDRRLLTRIGLRQALDVEIVGGVWQVACAQVSFVTGMTSFHPWGGGDVFSPATEAKSPLNIVREASETRLVPADIRKWLIRGDMTDALWRDAGFQTFALASAPMLVRSLASEVVGQESVIFSGPPRLNLALHGDRLVEDLDFDGYRNLQAGVAWVYEDASSAEQRHALFAAEFSRSIVRGELVGVAFRAAGHDILEGARLAFQLSQSDLSRESIKAQGDLRKAIADDTAKAAEITRTLSGAVAVAIATGITLIAARSAGTTDHWVLSSVAIVVAIYLIVVAVSGGAHLRLQKELRSQWRHRLYRFVPNEDYEAMVTRPAQSAERPYYFVATVAVLVAFMLFGVAVKAMLEPRSTIGAATTDDAKDSANVDKSVTHVPVTPTPPSPEKGESRH